MEGGGAVRGYQNCHWCVGSQGRDMAAREPPWVGAEWATSHG